MIILFSSLTCWSNEKTDPVVCDNLICCVYMLCWLKETTGLYKSKSNKIVRRDFLFCKNHLRCHTQVFVV